MQILSIMIVFLALAQAADAAQPQAHPDVLQLQVMLAGLVKPGTRVLFKK